MQETVKLKHLRVTARKAREVVDLIRGKTAVDAKVLLSFATRKSATPILKLLNSAVANAKHNHSLAVEDLKVSEVYVDGGPVLKRWMPKAHGRATPVRERTSHINLVLGTMESKKTAKAAKEVVAEKPKAKKTKKTAK